MHTKIGEASGQKLFSMDRVAWYRTPETARQVYERKQEYQRLNQDLQRLKRPAMETA